jgi:hypothetical protein
VTLLVSLSIKMDTFHYVSSLISSSVVKYMMAYTNSPLLAKDLYPTSSHEVKLRDMTSPLLHFSFKLCRMNSDYSYLGYEVVESIYRLSPESVMLYLIHHHTYVTSAFWVLILLETFSIYLWLKYIFLLINHFDGPYIKIFYIIYFHINLDSLKN